MQAAVGISSKGAARVSEEDKVWIEKLEQYIQENISDNQLSVSKLAREFTMSESSLLRKLKRLTGLSPIQYLQENRLDKARLTGK